MAEYVYSAPWLNGAGSGTVTPSRLHSHIRSLTPTPINRQVTKSISTPHLGMTSDISAIPRSEADGMNTIPDPRSSTPQPTPLSRQDSSDSSPHPDLSQEVSMLSTKLINAINHSTNLDDTLQQTRHDLETTKERLAKLEAQNKEYEEWIATGQLVEKEVFAKMEKQMVAELQEERNRRGEAEKAKRKVDSEVETLTSALFEEANTMVAAARRETEACEKRNDQLKQQLADADLLQQSLQEQMQDLKNVLERMTSERDEMESNTLPTTTAPSTPGITPADKVNKLFDTTNLSPNTPGIDEVTPDHPLHFSHLIHPILRSDLPAYKDFQDMLKVNARSAPSSRVSSGNYGGLNVLGLGSLTNNSTSSLPMAKTPGSFGSNSPRDSISGANITNLKDEKYYKRTQSEDIEPTLRLDLAPGLSWMARRTVINSITAGSLVVEPNPPPPKFRGPVFPCALCGEARKEDRYGRKFRFKTSEVDETRHPLCDWCLNRLRSTCDYVGFLRMVAAGHWRAETDEEKKSTWEESVRLRERMFWSRIGGGVIPSFLPNRDGPRSPTFVNGKGDVGRKSDESQRSIGKPLDSAVDMSEPAEPAESAKPVPEVEDDPFQTKEGDKEKRVSIGNTVLSNESVPPAALSQDEEKRIEEEVEAQLHQEVTKSVEDKFDRKTQHTRSVSTPISPDPAPRKKDTRLSLAIPGAFE